MATGLKQAACLAAVLAPLLAGQEPVRYELSFPNATHHEAEVRVTFPDLPPEALQVVMSRSSPGRYVVHEFARNVYNVRAKDETGRPLSVQRAAPNQWNISGHLGTVVFEYTLFGDLLDGTFNSIDLGHAHLNGPATFVWARGLERRPVRVKLQAPFGESWQVATQLKESGDGWWWAPSRDSLIDSPIEFSNHKLREWEAGGQKFRIAMHGRVTEVTANDLARMAKAVTQEAEGVFGEFPQFDNGRYTFLVDYTPYAATDAMEHRNSSVISQSFPPEPRRYPDLMVAFAHEFFHAWNVERIRPRSLEPFDLERANMSSELWFAEGITNYYGDLLLARSGIYSMDQFGASLSTALNAVIGAGRGGPVNAREMSRQAPLFDRSIINEPTNAPNTFVSYYYAGQALGAALDLSIRTRYPGKGLDDWMRELWTAHRDVHRPYTQDDLERALTEMTGDAGFTHTVFNRYLSNVHEIDYTGLLKHAGLQLRKASPGKAWAGISWFAFSEMGMAVTAPLLRGTPGYAAGLDRGDVVVRADNTPIKELGDWMRVVQSRKPGDRSQLRVRSSIGERILDLVWQESPILEIVPYEKAKEPVTLKMMNLREAWLGSKARKPAMEPSTP